MRKSAIANGLSPRYDGRCRDREDLQPGSSYVVRFKTPLEGQTIFEDLIHEKVVIQNQEIDDFVIQRTDQLPTYNLAVVIDDHEMGITHVIRGDDHISNTPRQILIYQALEFERPIFAHIPMIMGSDRSRLSKRHGATAVSHYQTEGFLPEALTNYLAGLGWGLKDQEILTQKELETYFKLENVNKTAAMFDPEKLSWMNAVYMRERLSEEELVDHVLPFWEAEGYQVTQYTSEQHLLIVQTLKERAKTLKELAQASNFYFLEFLPYEEKATHTLLKKENIPILEALRTTIQQLPQWNQEVIEQAFRSVAEKMELKPGKVMQPTRVALTGRLASPGMFEMVEILGKERFSRKLQQAIEWIQIHA